LDGAFKLLKGGDETCEHSYNETVGKTFSIYIFFFNSSASGEGMGKDI